MLAITTSRAGEMVHRTLFLGPPGTGKTMLASRLRDLLPEMSEEEAMETAAVASLTQSDINEHNWKQRPFRAPHHSSSMAALVGGGTIPRPGEISLAHNGLLFLDEIAQIPIIISCQLTDNLLKCNYKLFFLRFFLH
ncbi:TPA: ATP-binding protein [Vibrio vulnificus]